MTNDELPKTWEEFCENYPLKNGYFTLDGCVIKYFANNGRDINTLSSYEAAKAHLALIQLHQLRDCYRQGWKPNLKDNANKYGIQLAYNSISSSIELRVLWYQQVSTFLSFPTRELAEEFLTNFRELIEQAGDLI